MRADHELMKRVRAGDAGAFDVLFERYGPRVRARLLRVVRSGSAADDLLQEVFLRLWTRADQWGERGPLAAWLLRMATNLALNHLRSARRRHDRPLDVPDNSGKDDEDLVPGWMIDTAALGPDEIVEQAERDAAFRGVLDALPEQKRELIRMAHEAEMGIGEIADRLGIPPGTVKSRLYYARSELARQWLELMQDEENP